MSNRRLKITPQGWLVLAAIAILVVALIIILIVVIPKGKTGTQGAGSGTTAAPTVDPASVPETEPTEEPTPAPTEEPTPEPVEPTSKKIYTEPTAEMISYAVTGKTNKVGVNLRSGPGTDYDTVASRIKEGVTLTIYQDFGQWVFCQVDELGKFGYISRQFVTADAAIYMPATDQPADTYLGTINVNNTLTLRKEASLTSAEINNYFSGQLVYIYYIDGEFYYVMCAGTGETGYMKASYVTTTEAIPTKPAA